MTVDRAVLPQSALKRPCALSLLDKTRNKVHNTARAPCVAPCSQSITDSLSPRKASSPRTPIPRMGLYRGSNLHHSGPPPNPGGGRCSPSDCYHCPHAGGPGPRRAGAGRNLRLNAPPALRPRPEGEHDEEGVYCAVDLIMTVAVGGLLMWGPPCFMFSFVSSPVHKRSSRRPQGDEKRASAPRRVPLCVLYHTPISPKAIAHRRPHCFT